MIQNRDSQSSWGYLPSQIKELLKRREWDNIKNLKARLKGQKPFPIELHLKPPRGNMVLEDLNHFQLFVSSWRELSSGKMASLSKNITLYDVAYEVVWEKRGYRHLGEQSVPIRFIIKDIKSLAKILGEIEEHQLKDWQSKISFILHSLNIQEETKKSVFTSLIDQLETLTRLQSVDLELLVNLIPQLHKGMGENGYLRTLSVINVDTKFIENNLTMIEYIIDAIHEEDVKTLGLLTWLNCKEKPLKWLLVKPLCEQAKKALGGMPLLRLSSDTLLEYELPASNILIIENEQTCLSLPEITNTIAVAGGGKDISWMKAFWLATKRVAYWGDVDTEGLKILSDVRSKCSAVIPLMMDLATVEAYQERMVDEIEYVSEPIALTEDELILFRNLKSRRYQRNRLEQERIPLDYVVKIINEWIYRTTSLPSH